MSINFSEAAEKLADAIRRTGGIGHPAGWIREVESRAIFAFVDHVAAEYRVHPGAAIREDVTIACARFGVKPEWFFPDDEDAIRELRADVAHYRIMAGLE